jgi:hypothetical protein
MIGRDLMVYYEVDDDVGKKERKDAIICLELLPSSNLDDHGLRDFVVSLRRSG